MYYLGESEGLLDPVDPLGFRGWSLTKFRHEASLDSRAWIKGEIFKKINNQTTLFSVQQDARGKKKEHNINEMFVPSPTT